MTSLDYGTDLVAERARDLSMKWAVDLGGEKEENLLPASWKEGKISWDTLEKQATILFENAQHYADERPEDKGARLIVKSKELIQDLLDAAEGPDVGNQVGGMEVYSGYRPEDFKAVAAIILEKRRNANP